MSASNRLISVTMETSACRHDSLDGIIARLGHWKVERKVWRRMETAVM